LTEPVAPSGEQFELSLGAQRAVVVEMGGGLRAYSVDGRDVLDGYAADAMCTSGRGQVLLPWPNRLEDGAYEFGGRHHQLALTEPTNGNAIHGLVRWASWRAAEREPRRVVMAHTLHPQPGYPFTLELAIEYALSDDGLRVTTTATNAGPDACPFGSGMHPYLTVGTSTIDPVVLRVPAHSVLHSDERGLPTGSMPVGGTEYDFREPRAIGAMVLDNAFTDLERDDDGLARVELGAPDGAGLTLWVDGTYTHVMVFSGDPLPDVARQSLAVEPMTCPPNAFRTGDSLIRLEPGATHTSSWGIAPHSA
jgi:aldose 1-epimerase